MKKALFYFFILILLFIAYLLFNTFTFNSSQLEVAVVDKVPVPAGAAQRFVEAIAIRTVSFEDEVDFDSTQFRLFNEFLVKNYPLINATLEHQTFNEFSHLYKWTGSDDALAPIILTSHTDCLLYTSPSPRDATLSRMPSSA